MVCRRIRNCIILQLRFQQTMMSRATLIISMSVLCYCVLAAQGAPAPEPAPSPAPKDLSYISIDEEEGMPIIEDFRTKHYGELRTVLSTIKEQFREIIEELMSQVLNYFKEILRQVKVKLLRKLAVYKVSDVLRVVFDGFTDFIVDPVPDYYEPVREPVTSGYGYRPFSLASLLGSDKK